VSQPSFDFCGRGAPDKPNSAASGKQAEWKAEIINEHRTS
jgi:hypothetical protein